uniref:Cation-transporting P-type ATPase C-terminal domain-containing protein n=1 Tax=Globisporangium ultimum (strain ATCC 200006 / CBS 805.95 / DAOM BR144) TaxID=431595 RepID=K3WI46_GLOUD
MMFFSDTSHAGNNSFRSTTSNTPHMFSPRASSDYMDMTALMGPSPRASTTSSRAPPTSLHNTSFTGMLLRGDTDETSSENREEEHRSRFLSNSERLLADHPLETKESFANLESNDPKLWQATPSEVIAKMLETSLESGLSTRQLDDKTRKHGSNITLIFSSIAAGFPMPLGPLQILVLNLFSDGMPAVALSLEDGDPKIMEDRPRPKKQPLIHGRLWLLVGCNAALLMFGAMTTFLLGLYWNFGLFFLDDIMETGGGSDKSISDTGLAFRNVVCSRWNGMGSGWETRGNCAARFANGNLIFGAEANAATMNGGVWESSDMYCEGGNYECVSEGIARAQTMVFVGLAFTEVLRAYTVRSFSEPVFARMFSNKYMQVAAGMSLVLTIVVTNTPVIMDDIFGFDYIPWFQWLVVIATALNAAFWGELLKMVLRHRDLTQQRWDAMKDGFEAMLLEVRTVRHHVERLEH